MKKLLILVTLALTTVTFAKTESAAHSKLPTAENVEVARYIGKWYSVEALPQIFTRKCVAQSAEYDIINEKTISVHNVCYKKDGSTKDINGQAVIKDETTNARLEVTFNNFWTRLFRVKGEYVIIKLSEGYDTVMVGTTDRQSLWIMSRTPSIDAETLKEYKALAAKLGFDTSKLVTSKF